MSHRAPKMTWNLMVTDALANTVLVTPLYRQPGWSEVEAMVRKADPVDAVDQLLLMQDTRAVLEHLLQDVIELVRTSTAALTDLWSERNSNPALIKQPATQWKKVLSTEALNFPGYDLPPLKPQGNNLHVNPKDARRLLASKVLEDDAEYWRDSN